MSDAPATRLGRLRRWIAAHPLFSALAGLAAAGSLGFGFYWFAPWKLFVDARVDEPPPAMAAAPGKPAEARTLEAKAHPTSARSRGRGQAKAGPDGPSHQTSARPRGRPARVAALDSWLPRSSEPHRPPHVSRSVPDLWRALDSLVLAILAAGGAA